MNKTYLFYDYETFGANTRVDRISQVAGIRTDENFKEIDRFTYYCKPPMDYIPRCEASIITGITPFEAQEKGVTEAELAKKLHGHFNMPGTVLMGYNSAKFDDEITRSLFYRNFREIYDHEWKNGCSRFDILKLVVGVYVFDNKLLNWPKDEEGKVSLKLENLSLDNNIIHENAHDALSDVIATLEIAKIIKDKSPKTFNYIFSLRDKKTVDKYLKVDDLTLYSSLQFGFDKGYSALIYNIHLSDSINKNSKYFIDITGDIDSLINLDVDQLKERMFMKKNELIELGVKRVPVISVKINQSPVVYPYSKLNNMDIKERYSKIDITEKINKIKSNLELIKGKIIKIFNRSHMNKKQDCYNDIYGGFPSTKDKDRFSWLLKDVKNNKPFFDNQKYNDLYFRFMGNNYLNDLEKDEKKLWVKHCLNLFDGKIEIDGQINYKQFKEEIKEAKDLYKNDNKNINILDEVEKYVDIQYNALKKFEIE